MMHLVRRVLRRFGFEDTRDEQINAEVDDSERDHLHLVDALQEAFARRKVNNAKLRHSLHIAEQRTNSFADFERMTIRRKEMGRD
jgi:hypothetical protein